jgi:hypothetical protein
MLWKKPKKIAQFSYKQNLLCYNLNKQSMIDNIIYLEIKNIIICEIMLQNHKLDYFYFNILINIFNFIYVDFKK